MDYTENEVLLVINSYDILRKNLEKPIKVFNLKRHGLNFSYRFLNFYFNSGEKSIITKYSINQKICYDNIKIQDILNYKMLNEEVYSGQ